MFRSGLEHVVVSDDVIVMDLPVIVVVWIGNRAEVDYPVDRGRRGCENCIEGDEFCEVDYECSEGGVVGGGDLGHEGWGEGDDVEGGDLVASSEELAESVRADSSG